MTKLFEILSLFSFFLCLPQENKKKLFSLPFCQLLSSFWIVLCVFCCCNYSIICSRLTGNAVKCLFLFLPYVVSPLEQIKILYS